MQREKLRKLEYAPSAETSDLLRTKLAPPRPRSGLIARDALLARLDAGLERKLTLLSAPAGFGKTTLVSAWMAARSARPDPLPVAWVSLDAEDDDPVRFWRYIITACQEFEASLGRSALVVLQHAQQSPIERALTAFINDLARLPGKGVLVLEDYHLITSPQIHETMTFLLDHLPATLHVLLMSRSDPPLPFARWRAHNDLSEFDAADLRFSAEESQAFLQQATPLPLSSEAIAHLEERTEGWVAGLQLAALALHGRRSQAEVEQVLASFTGSHRHILEYLVGEVLSAQPEPIQEFLLQTAPLGRLSGSLCNALTGRNDSQDMLQELERANLFLIPLDSAGECYRYHALFAEAMKHEARRRLGEDAQRALMQQASQWYEQHGLLAEAVEAALAAQEHERAATLIERRGEQQGYKELYNLRRWVEQMPADLLPQHPLLCLNYAAALLYSLDRSAPATRALVEGPLGLAGRFWQAEGNLSKLGEVMAFRAQVAWWQGEYTQAFAAARQALEWLPEADTAWRGVCLLNMAVEGLYTGQVSAGQRAALEARALCEATGQDYGVRAATMILGAISFRQGKLRQATQLARQVRDNAGDDLADQGGALVALATLALERNELDSAAQQIGQALEIVKQHAEEIGRHYAEGDLLVPATLVQARLLHARGQTAQAHQPLQELLALVEQRRWPHLQREVRAWQAWLALATGDLAAAQQWYETYAQQTEGVLLLQRELEALVAARLLTAQGNASAALSLLEPWQAEARAQGRGHSELELVILTALAHASLKNTPQARQTLLQALALAQPEGERRLFLDEGEPMAALLRALLPEIREGALRTLILLLLADFVRPPTEQRNMPPPATAPLIEPLSQQERRVLRLLAAGNSNPEIAQELVVSVNTVKTQVQSIFRKLNVSSRKEARAAARQMKLA